MATNPNVPANQEAAATASAPDAKVVANQPAQLNQTAPAATTVSAPAATAPVSAAPVANTAATTAVKVDSVSREEAAKNLKADRAEEQADLKDLESKNEGADYFQEVANNDEVFNDPFREAARQERIREAEATKGDPTRDPVAKQEAMDMTVVAPGAKEEAAEIRDAGKK